MGDYLGMFRNGNTSNGIHFPFCYTLQSSLLVSLFRELTEVSLVEVLFLCEYEKDQLRKTRRGPLSVHRSSNVS